MDGVGSGQLHELTAAATHPDDDDDQVGRVKHELLQTDFRTGIQNYQVLFHCGHGDLIPCDRIPTD